MLNIFKTNSDNPDFRMLVKELDIYLAEKDGVEHAFYAQYNKLDSINHVLIGYDGNFPAVCGAMKPFEKNTIEIKRMYTAPLFRGKGYGLQILTALEKWAAELGYEKCILETGKRQPEAIRLYLRSGYREIPNYGQYEGMENSVCFEKLII